MASVESRQNHGENVASKMCKKPLDLGLRGEYLVSQITPAERHFSGARARHALERAYNGGPSVVDRADRE